MADSQQALLRRQEESENKQWVENVNNRQSKCKRELVSTSHVLTGVLGGKAACTLKQSHYHKEQPKNNPQLLQLFWIIHLSNSAPHFTGEGLCRDDSPAKLTFTITANICCIPSYILSIEQFCHPKKDTWLFRAHCIHQYYPCLVENTELCTVWGSSLLPSELEGTPSESYNALWLLTQNSKALNAA